MSSYKRFNDQKKNFTSKKSNIIFFNFFLLILYIIIWALFGEFNLSKQNWLVKLNQANNFNLLYLLISLFVFSILLFILIKIFTNLFKWDALPFLFSSNIMGIVTIISALIPVNSNQQWIIVARFVIVIASSLLTFFICNTIVNAFMLKSQNATNIFLEYVDEYEKSKEISNELKEATKNNNEKDYIEIERE